MTPEEKIQKHLELAMGSLKWMLKLPRLSPLIIHQTIVEVIHREFSNNEVPLHHFEIIEINESEYKIEVNKCANFIIKMEGKVGNG